MPAGEQVILDSRKAQRYEGNRADNMPSMIPLEPTPMPFETDERLKNYLDANQLAREQMCLAILALDKRFSNVRPRHPRGGPDGGRDIEALFRKEHLAYGAVGFVNQAADADDKKRLIRAKLNDDLEKAWKADPRPAVFVFLTNVNFTAGEKDELIGLAKAKGFIECDIFDRERLRIALDSPDGLAARFQYLGVMLSEAEQASFFAKWGDDINAVIATGFQEVRQTLDHLLFLQEAYGPISSLYVTFELDATYPAEDIGHFRAFCSLVLMEPKHNILSIVFGSADGSERFGDDAHSRPPQRCGIKHGIGGAQWAQPVDTDGVEMVRLQTTGEGEASERYVRTGGPSSIGMDPVKAITISYLFSAFIRFQPVLSLRDLDGCLFLPMLNLSLARRVRRIRVTCLGYKLLEKERGEFGIDESTFEPHIPAAFDPAELADPWVRLRPKSASAFSLRFSSEVPVRMFSSRRAGGTSPLQE